MSPETVAVKCIGRDGQVWGQQNNMLGNLSDVSLVSQKYNTLSDDPADEKQVITSMANRAKGLFILQNFKSR